ncbi:hypothetical protein V500_09386 [Pseudogymnoascus sp. VKM F-4518 (FW-2643)]|nr:hypothetical protein V500_09386 [Pseudogymnoascus sp. VKM F-4518 (FW-2643)]
MAPSALHQNHILTITNEKQECETADKTALQAISKGVCLPGIPIFNDFEKQRHWMLEHMALAFQVFARKGTPTPTPTSHPHTFPPLFVLAFIANLTLSLNTGFTEGMSGHISVRDPENPHTFWTNPLGQFFGLLQPSDMILVDYSGSPIGGNTSLPANAAGFQIHSAVHKARPDVIAACHTHSKAGKAWSAFSRRLEMLNQDVTHFYGDAQAVYSEFGGVVFDEAEAQRLATALGKKGKGMILRNHGLFTVGKTVDEAAYLFMLMERSCEVQLLVEAAAANGIAKVYVDDEVAEYTHRMTSDSETLYCEFQPDLHWELECSAGNRERRLRGIVGA